MGCSLVRLRCIAVTGLDRRQADLRPGLAGGAHRERQPADRDHLKRFKQRTAPDLLPVDQDGVARIEYPQANTGLRREQADVPARQPVVLQYQVAVVIAAEYGFFLDQRHFGAGMNARQNLHRPVPVRHVLARLAESVTGCAVRG